ncbi:hypothetical protein OHB25_59005 [Streptomyces mirabilis]|uniref:hypothetical protein n=1 Tax=Streptomyces mirabilis TaxID=68239 RepID=UPI002E1B7AF0
MKLVLWRVLLSPLTSLQALLLQRRSKTPLSYDTAWRQARMLRAPDEMVYRLHGHQAASEFPDVPGPTRSSAADEAGRNGTGGPR